jgi:iron(III) transport system substrate-binding protein
MSRIMARLLLGTMAAAITIGAAPAAFANGELNIYSSRHYDTDETLYQQFTEQTGITVNRIEGEADELIARMAAEGVNSPADVFLTVDAGRIWRADEAGLLQPIESDVLNARVPAHLRHPDGHWFGMSQRARIIFYDRDAVENPPLTYEALADPAYEGMICIRSSTNVYNQSLMASIIDAHGEEVAREWAAGSWPTWRVRPRAATPTSCAASCRANAISRWRTPITSCARSDGGVDGLSGSTDMIGWVFPNQSDRGTHMNVGRRRRLQTPQPRQRGGSSSNICHDDAQAYFANQNNEYPAVPGVGLAPNPASLGLFRMDDLNLAVLGENTPKAQEIFNEVGWD